MYFSVKYCVQYSDVFISKCLTTWKIWKAQGDLTFHDTTPLVKKSYEALD